MVGLTCHLGMVFHLLLMSKGQYQNTRVLRSKNKYQNSSFKCQKYLPTFEFQKTDVDIDTYIENKVLDFVNFHCPTSEELNFVFGTLGWTRLFSYVFVGVPIFDSQCWKFRKHSKVRKI